MVENAAPKERRCLCGLVPVKTGTLVIGFLELLIIFHSLIYVCTYISCSKEQYNEINAVNADIIRYEYLLPILVIQVLWTLVIVAMLIAVKTMTAFVVLPHILFQLVAVVSGIVFSVLFIVNAVHADRVSTVVVLTLVIYFLFSLTEIYLIYVVYQCYKFLKEEKRDMDTKRVWLMRPPRIYTIPQQNELDSTKKAPAEISKQQPSPFPTARTVSTTVSEERVRKSTTQRPGSTQSTRTFIVAPASPKMTAGSGKKRLSFIQRRSSTPESSKPIVDDTSSNDSRLQ